jgi:alpha-N-arabinofuranosidase
VPYLETVAVHDEAGETLTIFAVNRNLAEAFDLETFLFGFGHYRLLEHITMNNPDLKAVNSPQGEIVKPTVAAPGKLDGNRDAQHLEARLPPASWNVIRLGK